MVHKEQPAILKLAAKRRETCRQGKRHLLFTLCLIPVLLAACTMDYTIAPSLEVSPTVEVLPSATLPPTPTIIPSSTPFPSDPPGTIAMDFVALLCNADWMNGTQHLTPCPGPSADHSGGYAMISKDLSEPFPPGIPVVQMVANAGALFLRYPSYKVGVGDRFRTTLHCAASAPCDVQFALEYYDSQGQYFEFMEWSYATGDPAIEVDADLSVLAGQKVDLVLTLRLFHALVSSQHDNGLWGAPHIYRPLP